jgi:hypothetical protein
MPEVPCRYELARLPLVSDPVRTRGLDLPAKLALELPSGALEVADSAGWPS